MKASQKEFVKRHWHLMLIAYVNDVLVQLTANMFLQLLLLIF